ncbi:hypothetical protein G9A89_003684 [Geosiphon pyriformis]|nr:hypothetical protein G9A89_003684 [Geosiphon pyriformis]
MAQMLQQNNSHEPNQKPVNHVANFTLTPLKSLETQSNQQPNSQNLMQVPFNSNSIQQSSSFRIVDPLAQMVQHNNSHEFNQRPINNQQEFIPRLQHIRNNNNLNSFAAHNQANAIRNHDLRVNQFLNLEQNPNPALWQHFLNLERDLFNINQDLAKLKSLFFSKTEYNA